MFESCLGSVIFCSMSLRAIVSHIADDFRKHTSCVTEVERYEKRAPKKNGKVPPQQLWMELITSSIDTAPNHLKSHIEAMSALDNVPRKEKPFYNFTANSLNLRGKSGEATVSEIWKYLNDKRGKQASSAIPTSQRIENAVHVIDGADESSNKAKDSDKSSNLQKGEAVKESSTAGTTEAEIKIRKSVTSRKVVKKRMIQALKEAKAHSLTLKLLRKAVQKDCLRDERSMIKDLVRQNLDRGKHFLLEGKQVTLKVD